MSLSNPQEMGKPVAIKDEGLVLTPSVGSIDFKGSGVTGTSIGADVTETIPAAEAAEPSPTLLTFPTAILEAPTIWWW